MKDSRAVTPYVKVLKAFDTLLHSRQRLKQPLTIKDRQELNHHQQYQRKNTFVLNTKAATHSNNAKINQIYKFQPKISLGKLSDSI